MAAANGQTDFGLPASRSVGKRVLVMLGWLVLLFVPFVGFWAVLRPFFNERPSARAKWTCGLAVVAAVVLTFLGLPAAAGFVSFLNWIVWLHMVWRTTETS
jgi:Na+/phosphate symporter